jgi:hypothetical protein
MSSHTLLPAFFRVFLVPRGLFRKVFAKTLTGNPGIANKFIRGNALL